MEAIQSNPNGQTQTFNSSTDENKRCVAYYKPNIWSYDNLETFVSDSKIQAPSSLVEKLKEKIIYELDQITDGLTKLQLMDNVCKLGLTNLFKNEIMEFLYGIESDLKKDSNFIQKNVGTAALSFRLLRQHGFGVSEGVFADFLDKEGAIKGSKNTVDLLEASYLAMENDSLLSKANTLLAGEAVSALELPQHWRAQWFGVRQQIDAYGNEVEKDSILLQLAKGNFKMTQATHQRDLKELSMWWKSLGLVEKISFARDRLVESFVFSVGIAPEPNYQSLRKCLTKVISFILVLDDIYDVYGSLDELECFTKAVDRWDWEGMSSLPECMKICFSVLSHTTDVIAMEIQKETGFCGALPYLRKAWADFCKSMLTEARRYNKRYTPTLEEYLNTGWVSSSGSVLCMVILLHGRNNLTKEKLDVELEEMRELIYYTSLIIRLCNDVATTAAELERGDSPSSILCYMREAGVTEEVARLRIKDMIANTWKKINYELLKESSVKPSVMMQITNTARVAHCFYHTGDGFGVQEGDIKKQIKNMLFEPLQLD